jgi:hypothetical protein
MRPKQRAFARKNRSLDYAALGAASLGGKEKKPCAIALSRLRAQGERMQRFLAFPRARLRRRFDGEGMNSAAIRHMR